MHSQPNWQAFYRELGVIGPRLLRNVESSLLQFVAEEACSSDAFFSEALQSALESCWDNPENAVKKAVCEWESNVRAYLDGILGPASAIPWDLMNVPVVERERLRSSVRSIRADLASNDVLALVAAAVFGLPKSALPLNVLVQGIIQPVRQSDEGALIEALAVPWKLVVSELQRDWSAAFRIPPRKWEELVAGAFDQDGYDEVILTPSSGDHGRDVIAVKHGVGSIRIISSVKAYGPNQAVRYDDVRALLGVLHGDLQASKGIVTTTSTFAPRLLDDPHIAPFVPYRLELMDGEALRHWLVRLMRKR